MSISPSHRNPESCIQIECCDVCGRLVDNRELRTYDVQGLRGFAICGLHKFTGPGPEDLRRFSIPTPPSVEREQPIGADFWWVDPADFGDYLLVEEGGTAGVSLDEHEALVALVEVTE